ncbi:hypothetical protein [Pseudomonas sp. R5(2019)]|uniref:hypothetical protein n=1 Tax=Pseudomonas sp. R5(2019) TaxID=2697566 RepID=UPI0014127710|nr:hypothetical protein [Pseudomonas sp. R5(2019)]NBA94506.1 hypothetical protein [Pseudomonas sp. R5(2019)]
MKAWRVVLAVTFLLLSGCLVTFKDPIPADQAAPVALLGKWSSKDAWGEALYLEISRDGQNRYQAVSYPKGKKSQRQAYPFTVSRHGSRWYLSAPVPDKYGGHYAIAGFELTDNQELVVYSLDLERFKLILDQRMMSGDTFETDDGDGAFISSPLPQVFAYLDDPANSDVFVEAARYQRRTSK